MKCCTNGTDTDVHVSDSMLCSNALDHALQDAGSIHLPENTLVRRFTSEVNRVMDDEPVDMYRILMLFLNLQAVVSIVTKEPESIIMYSDYGMCLLYNDDEILIGISDEDSGCHILLRDDTQHSETVGTMSDFPSVVKDKILSYQSRPSNRRI